MDKDLEKNTPSNKTKNGDVNKKDKVPPKKVPEKRISEKKIQDKKIPDKKKEIFNRETNFEQTARLRIIKSEDIESTRKGKKVISEKIRKPLKTSSIYKKKYMILSLVVLVAFVLAYQFVKVKTIDFAKLSTNISKKVDMTTMEKGDELALRKLYGINKIEVDSFVSFIPQSNMEASEILIIKAKDSYVNDIVSRIQKRIDSQSNSFKNYAPAQYEILKKAELKTRGQYVYFISYKDVSVVQNAINESYK